MLRTIRLKCFFSGLLFLIVFWVNIPAACAQTYVVRHGQLSVKNGRLMDKCGNPIQLKGMSLFWSSYGEGIPYFNENTVKNLTSDYKCTVVRAPLAINPPGGTGYENDTSQANLITAVVDAAVKYGIYVIIDFHAHQADSYESVAKAFFTKMATKYKNVPNVLYEIWNEPSYSSWSSIRPYEADLITTIRAIDSLNVILCGTPTYDQQLTDITANPLTGTNIMYTMHFYAGTPAHQLGSTWLGTYTKNAVSQHIPIFVTEYGDCDASGNGSYNQVETQKWWDYLDSNKISYLNWGIYDKSETAAALVPGATNSGSWSTSALTTSGNFVLDHTLAGYDNSTGCSCIGGNSWTGTISSAWENPSNWSCGQIPDSTTAVIINSGTVVVSSNAVVKSLTLNPSVNFTVKTGYIFKVL